MWIFAQSPITAQVPGEQLAQSILNADALHTMQLIVFMVVLGWVLSTWLNGRSVSQMATTQNSMSKSNERFLEDAAKKTAVMQAAVEETKLLRESHDRQALTHQERLQATADAVRLHDQKADSHVQVILAHTASVATTQSQTIEKAVTDLLDGATLAINTATKAAVDEAGKNTLDAIGELKTLTEAVGATQQNQVDMLKRQQDAQMDLLKQQFDAQMQIINSQIDRTEKRLLMSIKLGKQPPPTEKHTEVVEVVGPAPPPPAPVENGNTGSTPGI